MSDTTTQQNPVTPLTDRQLQVLMSPLNQARVQARKQGGATLSYLAAWDVKATLIRVFGFGGFSADVIESEIISIEYPDGEAAKKRTVSVKCTVRLYIRQLDCTFTEVAASSQTGSQGLGDVADFALKTAESDALKRAAIYLGTQFGLSLYNNGSTSEVIRTIVAPGQEYLQGQRQLPTPEQVDNAPKFEGQEQHKLEEGEESQDEQGQQAIQQAPQQAEDPRNIRHPGTTDAQHEANQALLERALNAKPIQQDGTTQQ